MWHLKLLGQFELQGPEGRVALPGNKLAGLLAYLALAGKAVPRDQLATLLWGSHFEEQARQNLRQSLVRLRKVLDHAAFISEEQTVELSATDIDCDVRRFEHLLRQGQTEDLRAAVQLLGGELLAGIAVHEPGFEEWLAQERRRIGKFACDALVRLATIELDGGRPGEALGHAEAAIASDYFREDAHRVAILAMGASGQRAEAVRHYQTLAARLREELGTTPEPATEQAMEKVRKDPRPQAAAPAAAAVGRPSIAVLPFANLSNDPEQEYFADGIVEEIITALSCLRWLFVIARNSSFTYKGRAVDVRQVGRELGVRYVLEGSVRKAGDRVRIMGQLVDASDGATLWAGRSEGELRDLFDLQDRVTLHTIAAIAPRLEEAEIARSRRKPTESLDAYDFYLRGLASLYLWTKAGNEEALQYFKRAIQLDPGFAAAYGLAARCYTQRKASGWMADRETEEAEAVRLAVKAAELGNGDAVALGSAGFALGYIAERHEDGDALTERALRLNPNYAWGWFFSAWFKLTGGELDAAIERANRALQLSPNDPHALSMQLVIAEAHFFAGHYTEAVAAAETASRLQPDRFTKLALVAASYAQLGETDKARRLIKRLLELEPWTNLRNLRHRFPIKRDEHFIRWSESLRAAGLPE